jgi:hypothetical protein
MIDAETRPAEAQAARAVLMIRPARFASNAETAASNFFQATAPADAAIATRAEREFDALASRLAAAGVRVHEFPGRADGSAPDEVFPNNWLSLHADGTAVLYPMLAENRRRERRPELLDELRARHGYRVDRVVDLTPFERRGQYLEGTGSVVLDRINRTAYACWSPRTHPEPLAELGRRLGYEISAFDAADRAGRAIYHTNVLMSVGTHFAAVCTAALRAAAPRAALRRRLEQTGRDLIELTFEQLHAFAGNMLELRGASGTVIALSTAALASLDVARRRALERHGELVAADVGTIERYGGGSVRCMLAEVHLPRSGGAGPAPAADD